MKTIILALLLFTIIACDRAEAEYPFVGKWAGLSDDHYIEVHITKDSIFPYEMMFGRLQPIHFTIKGDSLHYSTFDKVVAYKVLGDSLLVLSNNDFYDTVYKLDQTIIMIDEIEYHDTVRIKEYESGFARRANAYYKSLGYEDYWDYSMEPSDTIVHLPPLDLKN
jgi:hypothetical protein